MLLLIGWCLVIPRFANTKTIPPRFDTPEFENSDYYIAAVVEHSHKADWQKLSPAEVININLNYLQRAAEIAASRSADIIVFPEYAYVPLLGRDLMRDYAEEIPDPQKGKWNPCEQKSEFVDRITLYEMSCLAKRYSMVIVFNVVDEQDCTIKETRECFYDGTIHYNANIAIDRDGTILAKYYKERLFFENGLAKPQFPQNGIFTTDFGNFSMTICFDIAYKNVVDDVRIRNVKNVILTTDWIDNMPLGMSVQFFQGWAMGNNVTLLVSNANIPGFSNVGSGVFSGYLGALKYVYSPDAKTKVLLSKVPKIPGTSFPEPNIDPGIIIITENGSVPYDETQAGKNVPDICFRDLIGMAKNFIKDYRCRQENVTTYTFIKLTKPKGKLRGCHNGLCCELEYSTNKLLENYYFGIFNGTHTLLDIYYYTEETCFLARCDAVNSATCDHFPLKANTVFDKIKLKSNFSTKYIYPSVLKSNVRLAPVSEWTYDVMESDMVYGFLKYKSKQKTGLLVASLAGRCYDKDPPTGKDVFAMVSLD